MNIQLNLCLFQKPEEEGLMVEYGTTNELEDTKEISE